MNQGRPSGVLISMLAALDVQYDDANRQATAAAVVFREWTDPGPAAEHTVLCQEVQPYVPGEFFRRELPCLLAVLREVQSPIAAIVIDGFVDLGIKKGLGRHLWEAIRQKTPIIGVAKTAFHGAAPVEVLRGESQSPLFITAAGIAVEQAAANIQTMAGPYRIPDLLRRVDQLARRRL